MLATHLLDVVIWDQALGLFLFFVMALLLGLPPVVVSRLLQDHQHVALADRDLVVALGHIVVDCAVYAEEHHCDVWRCGAPSSRAWVCLGSVRMTMDGCEAQ